MPGLLQNDLTIDWSEIKDRYPDFREEQDGKIKFEGLGEVSNNVWGKKEIVNYRQMIFSDQEKKVFGWKWDWPLTNRVVAYPEFIIGKKPWSGESTCSWLPRVVDNHKISAIIEYDVYSGNSIYNTSFDIWITEGSQAGVNRITHEIMIWLDQKGMVPLGKEIIKVDINGVLYSLYRETAVGENQWDYICFQKIDDKKVKEVNIDKFLEYLVKEDYLNDKLFLASIEFGNEIMGGSGEMIVKRFELNQNE
jgi:hypothetical protein